MTISTCCICDDYIYLDQVNKKEIYLIDGDKAHRECLLDCILHNEYCYFDEIKLYEPEEKFSIPFMNDEQLTDIIIAQLNELPFDFISD